MHEQILVVVSCCRRARRGSMSTRKSLEQVSATPTPTRRTDFCLCLSLIEVRLVSLLGLSTRNVNRRVGTGRAGLTFRSVTFSFRSLPVVSVKSYSCCSNACVQTRIEDGQLHGYNNNHWRWRVGDDVTSVATVTCARDRSKCRSNLVVELDQFFLELFALLNLTEGAARVFEIFSKRLQLIVGSHVIFSVLP